MGRNITLEMAHVKKLAAHERINRMAMAESVRCKKNFPGGKRHSQAQRLGTQAAAELLFSRMTVRAELPPERFPCTFLLSWLHIV